MNYVDAEITLLRDMLFSRFDSLVLVFEVCDALIERLEEKEYPNQNNYTVLKRFSTSNKEIILETKVLIKMILENKKLSLDIDDLYDGIFLTDKLKHEFLSKEDTINEIRSKEQKKIMLVVDNTNRR
jgi:hypothetical protein